mmetsp:Transcript_9663/g.15860  ORF Transcript_9663/g.15860 Transcript_9663/m.15860 type:complete len:150 (+) Transcript_9663:1532-1981(+)|eukprot:CAMPEP_0203774788 /NCGR_PEP_ID=MMETSP0099_2-20121227/5596_1 /ASSEMBLY_ACC=CAM_ASM_000209 /TAXON_ID=96639 /ORGANISM=" , Strain NY0313808BC1" /LENGTH=149 /DNA_ID=CAMNT_0050673145 /DNA_START=1528 /DNA_END=1977 /DNA_ORIENTATION=-
MRALVLCILAGLALLVCGEDVDATNGVDQAEVERLQKLFAKLSPECVEQVQSAYKDNSEVSEKCKREVQKIMGREARKANRKKKSTSSRNKVESDPTKVIVGFVLFVLISLVAWGVYAQKNIIDKMPVRVPKKKSKKKIEKERAKAKQN